MLLLQFIFEIPKEYITDAKSKKTGFHKEKSVILEKKVVFKYEVEQVQKKYAQVKLGVVKIVSNDTSLGYDILNQYNLEDVSKKKID